MKTTPLSLSAARRARAAATSHLITTLMVLALLGVIAAIIIPTVGKVRETAQRSVEASDRRQREMMAEILAAEAAEAAKSASASLPTRAGEGFDAEGYDAIRENRFVRAASAPLSTFSIDVDTASYSNVRRFLNEGRLPPRDAVRIEELINYFPYRYASPAAAGGGSRAPFAAHLAVTSAPWAPEHRLVRIALKAREADAETRPAANLVFLVDVSGSMSAENKLPLVKASLRMLLDRLRADDRVAIVTYAGASGLALPSTPAARRGDILRALERLESGGSTNGGMGIHLAYDIAKANFLADGINRVILCTDGDFNVGVTGREALLALIQEKARSRVFLTVLGFGMGNLKDGTLEQLADRGNGAYGYIDSRREARKVFVEQVEGTLVTVAKDVKIQVEFNPARVASYRLIGYENRVLAKEDFNDDRVDAGDVGAGHTVTALYEIVPAAGAGGARGRRPAVDPLKYGAAAAMDLWPEDTSETDAGSATMAQELLTVKIRYKEPMGDESRKLEFPLVDAGEGFARADGEFKFAAAVAAWGMLLRESPHAGTATLARVQAWAQEGLANDPEEHRAEFVELVGRTRGLGGR
ncbi:MAG: VWA domain-containing protein [Burkholderiales bacterium]|nr:VWA domain-containing protein [Opitutaceae bacterium]